MKEAKIIYKEVTAFRQLDKADSLREDAREIERWVLRSLGWVHSSSLLPGSQWLWTKEVGGRTIALPEDAALYSVRTELSYAVEDHEDGA